MKGGATQLEVGLVPTLVELLVKLHWLGLFFELLVQIVFVGCSVSMEILSIIIRFIKISCDCPEATKSFNALFVDVDVLDLRRADEFLLPLLGDFLLIHFHFLLVLLHTHMNAVHKDISIDYRWQIKSHTSLSIAKTSSS